MRSASAQISSRQIAFVGGHGFLEQLRGAADAGERVLDLMREHGRHAVQRTHRAAMEKLAVHALREAALLQDDDDSAFRFAHGRDADVGQLLAELGRSEIDIAFADGGVAFARLVHQLAEAGCRRV